MHAGTYHRPRQQFMVIPWWCTTSYIDIYNYCQRTTIARIPDIDYSFYTNLEWLVSLCPNSLRSASATAAGVQVYQRDGQLELELLSGNVEHPGCKMHEHTVWSPDGSSIASWRQNSSTLHLFDAAHGILQGSVTLDVGPWESCAGLLWGLYGIVAVLRDPTLYSRKCEVSSMLVCCKPA